jgi:hypothetical protein
MIKFLSVMAYTNITEHNSSTIKDGRYSAEIKPRYV